MRKVANRILCLLLCVFLFVSVGGTYATWKYATTSPADQSAAFPLSLNEFKYGTFYITRVSIVDGNYDNADIAEVGDVDISGNVTLSSSSSSSVMFSVTFYNNTEVSYYYDKTETITWDNDETAYTITGIEQKDEVPAKTSKTLYVTYHYRDAVSADRSSLSQLHFKFVVDKSSIGTIVAQTAVDRFRDILNNKVFDGSYQSLENAMNNRSGFNKASAVTYIGNVSGSTTSDSQLIETLFGEEFMSMDLDGDGEAEPITMMIKRENLDNNTSTGDSYTYTNWGREYVVNGAEMTLYITSENLDNVSSGKSVVVYAASFTKLPDSNIWTDLVPLTKGTANANNYGGYGSANSFNTDTWVSDDRKNIEELVTANT